MIQFGELNEFMNGDVNTSVTYARYWHGYLPVLRVLLIFFDLIQIRVFFTIILLVLFICFCYLLNKRFGKKVTTIFGITLLIYGYMYMGFSLENFPTFCIMMIANIILLNKLDKIKNIYLFNFFIACITNYFCYFMTPMITWEIPMCIYILDKQNKNEKFDIKMLVKTFLILALIPFLWNIVLLNHSVNHMLYIYRNIMISFCAILLILNNKFRFEKNT